jgi:hypothetical protein
MKILLLLQHRWLTKYDSFQECMDDTPPSSLINSTMSPRWKQWKDQELWVRSLANSTLREKGRVGAPRWEDKWESSKLFTWTCTNQTRNWLVHSWSTFGARTRHMQTRTSHMQTWTHKAHRGSDLGWMSTLNKANVFCHLTCFDDNFGWMAKYFKVTLSIHTNTSLEPM